MRRGNMNKRILSIILSVMVMVMLPMTAFAENSVNDGKPVQKSEPAKFEDTEKETKKTSSIPKLHPNEIRTKSVGDWIWLGSSQSGTVGVGETKAYEIADNINDEACHIVVLNENSNYDDSISIQVKNEKGEVKSEITASEAVSGVYSETGDTGTELEVMGDYWYSAFYTLSEGDRIILTAGSSDVKFAISVQGVCDPLSYVYGEFYYGGLYSQTQVIPVYNFDYPYDAVLYVENNSYLDFAYYMVEDGDMIDSTDGRSWNYLESDYWSNMGYYIDDYSDYYLVLFYMPGGEGYGEYDDDYEYYDEDYYDFAMCVSPANLTYYDIYGIKNKTYTGKALTQSFTLEYDDIVLGNADYKTSYSNNKKIGTAKVTIKGQAPYKGTVTKTFKIVPKGTSFKKLTRGKKSFTATWKKQGTQTTGYQIQYGLKKNFKGAKTVTVKGSSKLKKTVKKLKSKKTYYVRIRTYKQVGKTKYCSGWSKVKTVKTR